MKRQHRPLEDRIETTIRLPPAKDAIDAGVVNLPATFFVPFDRQSLPLASQVKEFQYVIEEGMEGQLRRRSAASHGQVRRDKFPEPLEAQFCWNLQPALMFCHFRPQKNGTVDRLRWLRLNTASSGPCGRIGAEENPQPVVCCLAASTRQVWTFCRDGFCSTVRRDTAAGRLPFPRSGFVLRPASVGRLSARGGRSRLPRRRSNAGVRPNGGGSCSNACCGREASVAGHVTGSASHGRQDVVKLVLQKPQHAPPSSHRS